MAIGKKFSKHLKRTFIYLIGVLFACSLVIWPVSVWLSRKFADVAKERAPTYLDLLRAALIVILVRFLPPMVLALSAYLVLSYGFELGGVSRDSAFFVLAAVLMIALVTAVSRALLSPDSRHMRLMPLGDDAARYIHRIIIALAGVFAIDMILGAWLSGSGASLELTVLRKFVIGLLIAGLLLALVVRRSLWLSSTSEHPIIGGKSLFWKGLCGLIMVLALTIPISAIAGYVSFSRLLATQIILTGGLFILVSVIIALCSEVIDELFNKDAVLGSKVRFNLALTEEGSELLRFWIKVAVKLIVYVTAVLLLLVMWGAGGEDLSDWLYRAFFGFKVGGVTVSIAAIFFAIALFSGVLVLTRLLQNFLEYRVLAKTRIDYGVQHSIRASVGYIGFVLAALFAISTLGIDLGKLAIIAGALSVGIGFGLQNVVNNFVSGLILLAERPIKVGDWVVVGDKQGTIKKINVRATEIQTFDRASVFIPNSDLISNPLLNWTHADKTGRVIVPVGVAYGSDTQKIKDILLQVASAHPAIFKVPSPTVIFKGFGDSSLNFELRAFIEDVGNVVAVNSELCFAIDAAFREHGVEIPFPQQDIHWKDLARLESLVMKIISDKRSGHDNS
nr:mechanosensitive ion channel domain-containing protein [Methylomarinum sp. Ch1-1]MDP4521559.1 mechanosensitive ion channel [Methylomarinum sp. Ch1-1]